MKKVAFGLAILLSFALLSFLAISQQPISSKFRHALVITPNIDLVEEDTCVTEFYQDIETTQGSCTYFHNYTNCLNTSGSNSDCDQEQMTWQYSCVTGTQNIQKNRTTCTPDGSFIVEIDNGIAIAKKRLDYSDFGPCIYEEQNDCLIITCQSIYDGAHLGQFTGCGSGSSCQKFKICEDSISQYLKNSEDDFVLEDPSFHLPRIELEEMEE